MSLVNSGLIVRYFVDEAASGTTPTHVRDRGGVGEAFDLSIDYQPSSTYDEVGGNRGINSPSNASFGPIIATTVSQKVVDALHGATKGTLEYVIRVDAGNSNGARMFGINALGTGSEAVGQFQTTHGQSTLGTTNPASLRINSAAYREWTHALAERAVWHVVVDTTQAAEADRVKVYKNGTPVTLFQVASLPQNTTFQVVIANNDRVCMLNRPSGNRSMDGMIFYGAIYSAALSAAEVQQNVDILSVDDDATLHEFLADSNPNTQIRSSSGAASDVVEVGFGSVARVSGDPPISFHLRHRRTP